YALLQSGDIIECKLYAGGNLNYQINKRFVNCLVDNQGKIVFLNFSYEAGDWFRHDCVVGDAEIEIPLGIDDCVEVRLSGNYYAKGNGCGTFCFHGEIKDFFLVKGVSHRFSSNDSFELDKHDVPVEVRQGF
ncbi:MAG: hypothetical protein AAFR49_18140, partial [Pseudomonadota bacterium]